MIENFMDYADGRCANMFTEGQKDRMWFYLGRSEFRGQNISVSAERNTGIHINNPCAPTPDFHVVGRNTTICQGGWIEYEDLSWNGEIGDLVWTFEGGSPSTSTFANPTVKYNTAGTYKVTLKASNAQGENTITKTEFITVLPEEAELKSQFI
jgi:PKD repeat protein